MSKKKIIYSDLTQKYQLMVNFSSINSACHQTKKSRLFFTTARQAMLQLLLWAAAGKPTAEKPPIGRCWPFNKATLQRRIL